MFEPDSDADFELEARLMRSIGCGDKRAFEELYDRFSGILFSTAFRVVSSPEAAEDVLQEVFLQIWEKAPLYNDARGKPLTWAVTLTRNKAIDRLRSMQRRGKLHDDLKHESHAAEQYDDRDSFSAVDGAEKGVLVREALRKISDEQRAALEMAFFRGMTQLEIAEELQEPLGTVKARIRRGMLRLRGLLDGRV